MPLTQLWPERCSETLWSCGCSKMSSWHSLNCCTERKFDLLQHHEVECWLSSLLVFLQLFKFTTLHIGFGIYNPHPHYFWHNCPFYWRREARRSMDHECELEEGDLGWETLLLVADLAIELTRGLEDIGTCILIVVYLKMSILLSPQAFCPFVSWGVPQWRWWTRMEIHSVSSGVLRTLRTFLHTFRAREGGLLICAFGDGGGVGVADVRPLMD